jgi:magnesium chelatase family protein
VPRIPPQLLRPEAPRGEDSAAVRARVQAARERQLARCGAANAHLSQAQTEAHCRLQPRDQALLEQAMATLQLSARAMHRILRVARSIADLDASEHIASAHLAEAIGYRLLDRGAVA